MIKVDILWNGTLSTRKYSEKVIPYDYPFLSKKMKVKTSGAARWEAYHKVFVGRGAVGRYVGAQEVDTGIWNIYYRNVLLGYIEKEKYLKKEQYQSITPIKV